MLNYRMIVVSAAALTFGSAVAAPAVAATTISSSAYDISINLRVASLLGVGLGPITASGGAAPALYADSDIGVALAQNLNLGVPGVIGLRERIVTSGMITAAQSPLPNNQSGSARAQVNGLNTRLGLVVAGVFGNLLRIQANSVVSRSVVTGSGGADAFGFTSLENLTIDGTLLGGATIDGRAFVNPAPNTVLFSLGVLGQETLKIILNEQIESGGRGAPGSTAAAISTNAIHIIFAKLNVANVGLLNGSIIISHSQAQINDAVNAVPEPAVWAQMIAGFALVGVTARRRQRAAARLAA